MKTTTSMVRSTTRRTLGALTLSLALAVASTASAGSGLDGVYRPDGSATSSPGDLRVETAGDGWMATFNGVPKPLRAVSDGDLGVLFQGFDAQAAHMQCAASDTLLLCSVDPGSRFPAQSFTSTTGYFAIIAQGAAFQLVRAPLPDKDAASPGT